jgi:hypothetical protein
VLGTRDKFDPKLTIILVPEKTKQQNSIKKKRILAM